MERYKREMFPEDFFQQLWPPASVICYLYSCEKCSKQNLNTGWIYVTPFGVFILMHNFSNFIQILNIYFLFIHSIQFLHFKGFIFPSYILLLLLFKSSQWRLLIIAIQEHLGYLSLVSTPLTKWSWSSGGRSYTEATACCHLATISCHSLVWCLI